MPVDRGVSWRLHTS